ncbi:MAG: hypothetical protein ACI8RA_000659, partial [Chlamydiales bacterium]
MKVFLKSLFRSCIKITKCSQNQTFPNFKTLPRFVWVEVRFLHIPLSAEIQYEHVTNSSLLSGGGGGKHYGFNSF